MRLLIALMFLWLNSCAIIVVEVDDSDTIQVCTGDVEAEVLGRGAQ